MFHRRRVARSRREYELQRAADFLFTKQPQAPCSDEQSDRRATGLVAGQPQMPSRLRRLDELLLSRLDVPALTLTADPDNRVAVTGSARPDWRLRFCVEGEGQSDDEAREQLHELSMIRAGGTVSLAGSHILRRDRPRRVHGSLVVEGPADGNVVVHASYTPVYVHDMTGSVRIAATHARAKILGTTGQVDATSFVIDFAACAGQVTLSAEAEINMLLGEATFDGTLMAWAQRCVRMLVPAGFVTPFQAIVRRREDFICRTAFAARVVHERKGELHYFTYGGAVSTSADTPMHVRSEQATVVIDSIQEPGVS